jgi:DNA invertase Pin-like site-specific DNA recombinase
MSSGPDCCWAQIEALKAAGCERIYSEKASGKSIDGRPEFRA